MDGVIDKEKGDIDKTSLGEVKVEVERVVVGASSEGGASSTIRSFYRKQL